MKRLVGIYFMRHLNSARLLAALLLLAGITACETTGGGRVTDMPLSAEPLAGKFVWHDLMTDDVAVARRFYGGLFGWSFESTTGPNGGDYTLITAGSQLVGGMVQLADPAGEDYSRWLGYLSVPDVDEAGAFAQSKGGITVVGPLDLPNIGRPPYWTHRVPLWVFCEAGLAILWTRISTRPGAWFGMNCWQKTTSKPPIFIR